MPGVYCSATDCNNSYRNTVGSGLRFFRFPKDADRCKQWVLNSRKESLKSVSLEKMNKNYALCSEHFELSQFMNVGRQSLIHSAVPTIFNPPKSKTMHAKEIVATETVSDTKSETTPINIPKSDSKNVIRRSGSCSKILPAKRTSPVVVVQRIIKVSRRTNRESVSSRRSDMVAFKSESKSDDASQQEMNFQFICEHGSTLCSRDWICRRSDDYASFGLVHVDDGHVRVKSSVRVSKILEVEVMHDGHKAALPPVSTTKVDARQRLVMILDQVEKSHECRGISSDDDLRDVVVKNPVGVLENFGVWRHRNCTRIVSDTSSLCGPCEAFQRVLRRESRGTQKSNVTSVSDSDAEVRVSGERHEDAIFNERFASSSSSKKNERFQRGNKTRDEKKLAAKEESENDLEEQTKLENELEIKLEMSSEVDNELNVSDSLKRRSRDGFELRDFDVNESGGNFESSINGWKVSTNEEESFLSSEELAPALGDDAPVKTKRRDDFERVVDEAAEGDVAGGPDPTERVFKCKHCDETFLTMVRYMKHRKTHDREWRCNGCEKRFITKSDLLKHVRATKCRNSAPRRGELLPESDKKLSVSMSSRPIKCELCGAAHGTEESLAAHKILEHSGVTVFTEVGGPTPFQCKECGKSFRRKVRLHGHYRRCHMAKEFKCSHCDKRFFQACDLKQHQAVHEDQFQYHQCDACGRCFKTNFNMLRHKIIAHSKERPYVCEHCGKSFAYAEYLKYHLSVHGIYFSETRHVCRQCNRSFLFDSFLKRHVKQYSKDGALTCRIRVKPSNLKCRHCDATFTKRSAYEEHLTFSHDDHFHFQCNVCGKVFKQQQTLSQHRFTHSDERPFVCHHCGKSFKFSYKLKSHVSCQHSTSRTLFPCGICDRKLSTKGNLTVHMRIHSQN